MHPALCIDPATVRRLVLPNGLTVLLRRDDTAPVVAIVTYVKAGYFDETDDVVGHRARARAHVLQGNARTRPVGAISKETKSAGGYLNAGTIYDRTSYYTVLPAASFARGLDIQRDAYANSVIDAEELAKELEVIIQEAKRKADNPSAVATETLFELLHDEHRMRRWRIGREDGLRKLTRDASRALLPQLLSPALHDPEHRRRDRSRRGRATDRAAVRIAHRRADRAHARAATSRSTATSATASSMATSRRRSSSFGWRTPGTLHPDTPLLELAGTMLGSGRGSRLYRAVRERKLATSVSAYDYTPTELGVFVVHAEGPPEKTVDAARNVWAQLADVRANGFGDDELNRARQLLEARFVRRLETMEGQANYLAEWEALGDWQLGERELDRLLTATAAEVTDAVRRHLTEELGRRDRVSAARGAPVVAAMRRQMRAAARARRGAACRRSRAPAPVAPGARRRARASSARRGACASTAPRRTFRFW